MTWCSVLKKDWKAADLTTGTAGYSVSMTLAEVGQPPTELTDVDLASTWFYGDLVHAAQEEIDKGKVFQIDQRYAAAAVRVAQLAVLARDTLSFIQTLVDGDVLPLGDDALKKIPVKTEFKQDQLTGAYSAPPGTAIPGTAREPLSEEWTTLAVPGTEDGVWALRIPWGHDA